MIWTELQVIQKDTSRMHLVRTERERGGEHKEVNTIRCRTSASSSQQSDTITNHRHRQTQTATNTRTHTKHDLLVVQHHKPRRSKPDSKEPMQMRLRRERSSRASDLRPTTLEPPPARGAAPARSSSTSCMISLTDESIAGTSPQRAVRLGARVGRPIRRIS